MPQNYTAPEFNKTAFNCPHCNVYAKQEWISFAKKEVWDSIAEQCNRITTILSDHDVWTKTNYRNEYFYIAEAKEKAERIVVIAVLMKEAGIQSAELVGACCSHCKKYSYWHDKRQILPAVSTAPMPHEDMPAECQKIYSEARDIADKSPRAAAALLRLCLQSLLPHLGAQGSNINTEIAKMVSEHKIPPMIQQALDTCRVVGNHAVHPGEIELEENPQIVAALFDCLNMIVEKVISEPKQMEALYKTLPQKDQDNIVKRDSAAAEKPSA